MARVPLLLASLMLTMMLVVTACSGDPATPAAADAPGDVRLVAVEDAATIQADPPADLVILDVRTPEEFAGGHLAGATLLDFYEADFRDRLADLDRDTPYLLYCRSGNRSGQAREMMAELGFRDVADVDGGVVAWDAAGLPLVTG